MEDASPSSLINNSLEKPQKEEHTLEYLGWREMMLNKLEESKESNKEFMNVTKQTKINRGASSQVPTF